MFKLFKITTPTTRLAYYGYADNVTNIKENFANDVARSIREDGTRGMHQLFEEGATVENIVVEVLGNFGTEFEAYVQRNNHRASDPFSITGPTPLPFAARIT